MKLLSCSDLYTCLASETVYVMIRLNRWVGSLLLFVQTLIVNVLTRKKAIFWQMIWLAVGSDAFCVGAWIDKSSKTETGHSRLHWSWLCKWTHLCPLTSKLLLLNNSMPLCSNYNENLNPCLLNLNLVKIHDLLEWCNLS